MTNREKIIKALECCKPNAFNGMNCEECPYKPNSFAEKRDGSCIRLVHAEAIDLLKEQDNCENCAMAIEDKQLVVWCKDCKWYDERISMCDNCGLPREKTFFCADGKRRKVE